MREAVDWSTVDLVLLDMDGTVLDLAFDNFFWVEAVPRHYAEARGIPLDDAKAQLQPEFDSRRGTLPWYSLDHWSRFTGLDLRAVKRSYRDRIAPAPGAVRFLDALAASGRPAWLVTNADPTALDIKMLHTGIEERFEHLVTSHEFGAPKEAHAFWKQFVAERPFDPARALFVDDSEAVLGAARDFGIGQVLGIRWPDTGVPARETMRFPSIERLVDLLPVPPRPAATAAPA